MYISFEHQIVSNIILIVIISFWIYLIFTLCRGVWGILILKESAKDRIFGLAGLLACILSYVQFPWIQFSGFAICFIMSGCLINSYFFPYMNLNAKIVISLLLNFSFVNQWMPFGLLALITCLCYVISKISLFDP